MYDLNELGNAAKNASYQLEQLSTEKKNTVLKAIADKLVEKTSVIIEANKLDLEKASENGVPNTMLDRLSLSAERIADMAEGVEQVGELPDPVGEVIDEWTNDDGLLITKKRVPMGVIGIIYEARPNVTTDAASLCFKTGNAVILRGGKEAFNTNQILVSIMQDVLVEEGIDKSAIQLIQDTSREVAQQFMRLNQYLDVLIPRGGAGLIKSVLENSTVPVIETGTGNCHIYVDASADIDSAVEIIENAKCQRPSVCNACETVIIHSEVAPTILPMLESRLVKQNSVELRADDRALAYLDKAIQATTDDWDTEYNDYILAIKVVDSLDEAIKHINSHNTKHSESIITNNNENAERFLNSIDAAAVYVNASTRFTDGFVFGFGAEIGISTQKLHARGPMGLPELTSYKYQIKGNGQIRS